jgi:CMP-N,N'-diacetyllegionaminic acid synthase
MRVCAIIPARGGSKGILGKNIRPVAGRPLVVHSIDAALEAAAVDRVIVSTDDAAIADVARAHGAEVVWRPAEISGDTATSESALIHTLDQLQESESYQPDLVVFLQATSPLRRPGDVQNAVDLLVADGADSLFSACLPSGFVWRLTDGVVGPLNYDPTNRPRRQDAAEEILIENGSIYVFKPSVLRGSGSRLGGKIAVYMMHANDSFEIDEPEDLVLLESLARMRQEPAPVTEQ